MTWIKKHKNEILVGVITSLIVQFGSPLLVSLFTSSYNLISLADLFNVYRQAALFTSDRVVVFILLTIFALIMGAIVSSIIILGKKKNEIVEQTESLIELSDIVEELENAKDDSSLEDDPELKNDERHEEEKIALSKENLKNKTKKLKKTYTLLLVYAILIIAFETFYLATSIVVPSMMNDSFNRSIEIITPYTSQDKIAHLKSDWRRMKNIDDYNNIDLTITQIRDQNSLQ